MSETTWAIIATGEPGICWESPDGVYICTVFNDIRDGTNLSGEFDDSRFTWKGDLLLIEIHDRVK